MEHKAWVLTSLVSYSFPKMISDIKILWHWQLIQAFLPRIKINKKHFKDFFDSICIKR